jgi:hypothetical protein
MDIVAQDVDYEPVVVVGQSCLSLWLFHTKANLGLDVDSARETFPNSPDISDNFSNIQGHSIKISQKYSSAKLSGIILVKTDALFKHS